MVIIMLNPNMKLWEEKTPLIGQRGNFDCCLSLSAAITAFDYQLPLAAFENLPKDNCGGGGGGGRVGTELALDKSSQDNCIRPHAFKGPAPSDFHWVTELLLIPFLKVAVRMCAPCR